MRQWAAVRMWRELMMVPPHWDSWPVNNRTYWIFKLWFVPTLPSWLIISRYASQGYLLAFVFLPPTTDSTTRKVSRKNITSSNLFMLRCGEWWPGYCPVAALVIAQELSCFCRACHQIKSHYCQSPVSSSQISTVWFNFLRHWTDLVPLSIQIENVDYKNHWSTLFRVF